MDKNLYVVMQRWETSIPDEYIDKCPVKIFDSPEAAAWYIRQIEEPIKPMNGFFGYPYTEVGVGICVGLMFPDRKLGDGNCHKWVYKTHFGNELEAYTVPIDSLLDVEQAGRILFAIHKENPSFTTSEWYDTYEYYIMKVPFIPEAEL